MKGCYYCQGDLDDKKFEVTGPQQEKFSICSECMGDIFKFFQSGQAEEAKLSETYEEPSLERSDESFIDVDLKTGRLIEVDQNGKFVKMFINTRFDRVEQTPMYTINPLNIQSHFRGVPFDYSPKVKNGFLTSVNLQIRSIPLDNLSNC